MGDESSLSQQIGSVERSVVFLRQEHLTLLHGLHLEILSLQKRCSGEGHAAEKLLPDPTFDLLFLLTVVQYKDEGLYCHKRIALYYYTFQRHEGEMSKQCLHTACIV